MMRDRNRSASLLLLALGVASLAAVGCRQPPAEEAEEAIVEPEPEPPRPEWALAIHGGAGVIAEERTDRDEYYRALAAALDHGRSLLAEGTAALEVVEQVVRLLEDDPRFNAGRGAVFTDQGTHELDAAIMDGRTLSCGAVAGVRNVRNPITLARRVMERSPHVLLVGDGADRFAREVGVDRVPQDYFTTQERLDQWRRVVREERTGGGDGVDDMDTVGAVALDRYGNLAAGTSTGGLTNKHYGRVGDVPVIGAGTYANNRSAAISCTGKGEQFIRHNVAHDVSALIEYRGLSVAEAARTVIEDKLEPGDGGLIAVGADGTIALAFNSPGMFRGAADSLGRFEVGIWNETLDASPFVAGDAATE